MKSRRSERVTFNVSGEIYETYRATLKRYPETLLGGNLNEIKEFYKSQWNEYFVNRCRICFGAILFFYQSNGLLLCPLEINVDVFSDECNFYKIPQKFIIQMKIKEGKLPHLDSEKQIKGDISPIRKEIWAFLDYPESSNAARWYAIVSFIIISLSIVLVCLETVPALHVSDDFAEDPWSIAELILNVWFLLEFLTRLVLSPNKKKFLSSILNWIDAGAVIPYFVAPFFTDATEVNIGFLRILKFVRVMRLFRLSKHSKRLKVAGEIIKSSAPDFQLLLLCLGIAVIFGGSVVYFTEKLEKNTKFISIPAAFWWAIQAITTVGYGDIVPTSALGKLMAAIYSIVGIMTISLPALAIVAKFAMFYEKNVECNPWD